MSEAVAETGSEVSGEPAETLERRCASGERCQDREPERDVDGRRTGAWLPRQIDRDRGLCDACARNVSYALNHLPGDIVELTMKLARVDMASELVSASPELLVPIRLDIDALRTEIDTELQNWAEPVAERLGITWDTAAMGRSRQAVRVQRAAQLLAKRTDVLLDLPSQEHSAWDNGEPVWDPDFWPERVQETIIRDGIDGGLALLRLHRRAYHALGRTEYVQQVALPCPRCGLRALIRHNGEDSVICENCYERTPWERIPFLCRVLIDCERALDEGVA